MVIIGLTHCRNCMKSLKNYEYGLCTRCKEEENQKKNREIEKIKQEKQAKIDEIINFFSKLNDCEKEGLEEIIKEKGKEVKQRKIKEEIEKLEKELED